MIIELLIFLCLFFILLSFIYLLNKVNKTQRHLQDLIQEKTNNQFNQIEAYTYLRDRLDLRKGMPYTTHWSASPDFLKIIVEHCLDYKPETIVECSSGLTTLMLARCCQLNNKGKVFSLENGKEYADKTRNHIKRYELENYSNVLDAPLEKTTIKNTDFSWYTLNNLPENSINMLVIDGPPGFIQKNSRYPALPLLFDKLAEDCVIFMDDAARDDEKEIVELWLAEHPELEHRFVATERGCSILNKKTSFVVSP